MRTNHISQAREAILNSSYESAVYIGCDSIRYRRGAQWMAKYSTVVILHMDGNKGCKLFYDDVELPDYGSIKQRMLTEVQFAVQHASDIIDAVGERHLEIHLDINSNPKHKSHVALKEAVGYIRGSFGFDPIFKSADPNALVPFAASHAADHAVRSKFHPIPDLVR